MAEKILIAYYSKTGNTKRAAEEIAKMTGGTLHRIVPQKTYPDSYFATVAVAKWESLKGEKPALAIRWKASEGMIKSLWAFPYGGSAARSLLKPLWKVMILTAKRCTRSARTAAAALKTARATLKQSALRQM